MHRAAVHLKSPENMLVCLGLPMLALAIRSTAPTSIRAPAPRATVAVSQPVFSNTETNTQLKMELLMLAAALDRGQSYNPTSSDAYAQRMQIATGIVEQLAEATPPLPTSLAELDGEWELVFTGEA